MKYNCRLYINSGFNENNIPDSPALLELLPNHIDVPALDILQERVSSVRVQATWDQVKNSDYMRLIFNSEAYYYAIRGDKISMQATDVAEIPVVMDYVLTYGLNSGILDGITERVHVSSDDMYEYLEDDPLLNPNEPLVLKTVWIDPMRGADAANSTNKIYIEATSNPIATQKAKLAATSEGIGSDGNKYTVTFPQLVENENMTNYTILSGGSEKEAGVNPGTCIYMAGTAREYDQAINEAVQRLRALGVEQAVIRQVSINTAFVSPTETTATSIYDDATRPEQKISYKYVSKMTGKTTNIIIDAATNPDMSFEYASYVKNKKVLYSNITKYGLTTCAGNNMEATAADIHTTNVPAPVVKFSCDPHLDGRPYWRFATLNGETTDEDFWRNCLPGMPWKEVPLIYQGKSGSALDSIKIDNEKQILEANLATQRARHEADRQDRALNFIGDAFGVIGDLIGISGSGAGGNIFTGAFDAWKNQAREDYYYSQDVYTQTIRRASEVQNLNINNNVVAPQVTFPYNSEIVRDFYGNGAFLYRYQYSTKDIARIDKLLTMYGYKVTKALEQSDFNNRKYFNFVQCSNVSVTGHAAWINDGIAEELRAGVRVWHVLPDPARYFDNPIKES